MNEQQLAAVKLALEALERIRRQLKSWDEGDKAITALKQALAAPVQEPSPGGVLFAVEQAIENGDCPMGIEIAFEAYEKIRMEKNNG